ncbi:hypothetical protein [Chitinophaga japonensis]|uniref:Uncharacterized protein n=1 Tax=Chitinophaga japonensis TaxID=104662 RepID=A0A562SSL7_CHIJA|nr:hypothetical protein [Chitinophaga japonensis]TWI84098.1 hypothetical protein LX66_4460 [Chitinophaga japonensis]
MELIIEKADVGFLGRVHCEDNLIIDEADNLETLEENIKKALKEFHGLNPKDVKFERKYDLSALFEKFNYLKISIVAELAGLNASLLRQYVTGVKHPSVSQAKKIEEAIHRIGNELNRIHVYAE